MVQNAYTYMQIPKTDQPNCHTDIIVEFMSKNDTECI